MEMEVVSSGDELGRWLSGRRGYPRAEAPLGQVLLAARLIDDGQLERALAAQRRDRGRHLGRILIEQGALAAAQVNEALAAKLGIPRVRLDAIEVPAPVLGTIPPELALRHGAMPIARKESTLVVALENPFDTALLDLLRFNTGLEVVPAMASGEDIALAHARYYSRIDEDAALEAAGSVRAEPRGGGAEAERVGVEREANRPPIVRLLESILRQGVLLRASDINIRPEGGRVALYYRVDGRLRHVRSLERSLLAPLVSRVKIVGQMNIAERRLAQEGGARISHHGRDVDLRLSVIPTVQGESVVIRLLDREAGLRPLAALGLSAADEERVRRIVRAPNGLFLVTGPTGSGKSTTLYALLNDIRRGGAHILTVEDPVEYRMDGVEQVQIAERIGYTFAEVLRRFLRHDPDVIMVGEIRDGETAAIACRAALTGHFVLSSLHTNDAPGAVARLVDMGVEPYIVASTLRGVMAQRLIRLGCRHCRERPPSPPGPGEAAAMAPGTGRACDACGGTGYAGRCLVCEVMPVGPAVAAGIARGSGVDDLAAIALQEGMTRIADHAIALARRGLTTVEEARSLQVG